MSNSPEQVRMKNLIAKYYLLNRVTVGEDTSRFVKELAAEIDAKILSVPSGAECLTWVIPPKWTVREGYVETLEGKRIVDFKWHPLYLKSYSAPFSGTVTREELLSHVSSDETRPFRLVYNYRWQYQYGEKKDWGFSMPHNTLLNLGEDYYRVYIDSEFSPGTMDIIDLVLPGRLDDTIFFAAHTCHPGQVNDGIACVAVLMELFLWLKYKPLRRYTYRMILGPEYFAAAGMFQYGKGIDKLKYGFYLDMLGSGEPLVLSRSYRGNSYADILTRNVLRHNLSKYLEKPYRGLWGNDELFYDGPDFQIPTVCIGRDMFENYHTDLDNLDNCDFEQLEKSLGILKNIIDIFESDCIPVRKYKGPLYLSRYGLYIDWREDLKGHESLQEMQILMNGERTCLEIAETLDLDYRFVRNFVEKLCDKNLAFIKWADNVL